jgi:hypothetical protein
MLYIYFLILLYKHNKMGNHVSLFPELATSKSLQYLFAFENTKLF